MTSKPLNLTVHLPRKVKPRNAPRFVEIYSAREGVWVWSVAFDDLGYSRTGKSLSYEEADAWVHAAIEAAPGSHPT